MVEYAAKPGTRPVSRGVLVASSLPSWTELRSTYSRGEVGECGDRAAVGLRSRQPRGLQDATLPLSARAAVTTLKFTSSFPKSLIQVILVDSFTLNSARHILTRTRRVRRYYIGVRR